MTKSFLTLIALFLSSSLALAAPDDRALTKQLGSKDAKTRRGALQTIINQKAQSKTILKSLKKALRDSDNRNKVMAAQAMLHFGEEAKPAMSAVSSALDKADKIKNGNSRDEFQVKEDLKVACLQVLMNCGTSASGKLSKIKKLVSAPHHKVRIAALNAMGFIGKGNRKGASAIAGALADKHPQVRAAACYALIHTGPAASSALKKVSAVAKDTSQTLPVRRAAFLAIGAISDGKSDKSVALLMDHARDKDRAIAGNAVISLGWIGPKAKKAVSMLFEMGNPKANNNRLARASLAMIDPVKARPWTQIIVDVLKDSVENRHDRDVVAWSARAIGFLGEEAKSHSAEMKQFAESYKNNGVMLSQLCEGLGAMGVHGKDMVPFLETMTKHKEETVRDAAKTSIETIKKALEPAKK
ncbi:MAG: HEAT repeat domain-containing protein [Planctomycetota bacterium]|nr:HEAT repeat domain-containing protein [Planctomycetota bacterium]